MSFRKQMLFWFSMLAIAFLVQFGIEVGFNNQQPETRTTQPETFINRIDLLTCQGKIFGTFYFYPGDHDWRQGASPRIIFTDYRGREIQYSGHYLVTPILDTVSSDQLSVNSNQ